MIGGVKEGLNPAVIHLNEDGSAAFETCQSGTYGKRNEAVGDFLEGQFFVCGGLGGTDV